MEVAAFKYNSKVIDSEQLLLDNKFDRRKLKYWLICVLKWLLKDGKIVRHYKFQ